MVIQEDSVLKVDMVQQHQQQIDNDTMKHKDMWWKLLYTLFTLTAIGYLAARRKKNRTFHLIKPFPVLILGYVVLLWCSVHHSNNSASDKSNFVNDVFHFIIPHNPSSYAVYVSIGLFLSAIGDLFLIYDRTFVHGVIFFLTAHLSFILAFTTDSDSITSFFTPFIVVFLVGVNIFFVYVFITKIIPLFIKTTPKTVVVAIFFYMAVIVTMCYTASVKALSKVVYTFESWDVSGTSPSLFEPSTLTTLYTICGALGAVLFFVSDIMILIRAINSLKNNQVSTIRKLLGHGDIGMITYWLGQFCIALSVTASLN